MGNINILKPAMSTTGALAGQKIPRNLYGRGGSCQWSMQVSSMLPCGRNSQG